MNPNHEVEMKCIEVADTVDGKIIRFRAADGTYTTLALKKDTQTEVKPGLSYKITITRAI